MPISNLSFVSKLLRRVVASQLHAYPSANGMYEPFKSGYRKGHSAETALLRVQNDILLAMDQRKVVRLLLFDLSAAFDTVGYDILLHCLERCFGISREASAHTWQIENKLSLSMVHWVKRVPQGSVLGPILFTLYMSPLGDIIRRHQRGYHMYADDTQLYISISRLCSGTEAEVLPRIQHCFEDINCWTAHNQLKLNNEKTEVIICGRKQDMKHINIPTIDIGGCDIPVCNSAVRNLGVMTDPELSMASHINRLCQSLHYHLRNIENNPLLLVQVIHGAIDPFIGILSLGHGNALLYGVPSTQPNRLQKVQNTAAAARIVTRSSKFSCAQDLALATSFTPH